MVTTISVWIPASCHVSNNQFMNVPIGRNYGQAYPAKQDNIFGGVNWSHQFNDDWSIKHSMSVNQSTTNQTGLQAYGPFIAQALLPGNPADQIALALYQQNATYNVYATNMDLTGHFDTLGLKHTLLLGGDYYRTDSSNSSASSIYNFIGNNILNPTHCADPYCGLLFNPTSPYTVPHTVNHLDQYGLYLQDQIKLPYDFHVTGGFRYQNLHQASWTQANDMVIYPNPSLSADAVTPRVGLLWQPRKWLSLYSNYTENFGANSGNVYVNDSTIKAAGPTGSQQWEVGFKNEFFDGRLRTTFAYYNLTKQNVQTSDIAHPGFVILTGEVRSRGPELDIQGEILPGWNMIATYANTDIIVTKASDDAVNNYPTVGSRYWGVPETRPAYGIPMNFNETR